MFPSEFIDFISQYVVGERTIEQLQDWYVPKLPRLLKNPESAEADIVSIIELGLAEMSDGIRTEQGFRNLLRQVLVKYNNVFVFYPSEPETLIITGSSNYNPEPYYIARTEITIETVHQ